MYLQSFVQMRTNLTNTTTFPFFTHRPKSESRREVIAQIRVVHKSKAIVHNHCHDPDRASVASSFPHPVIDLSGIETLPVHLYSAGQSFPR
jgi:hypothetical protein